MPQKKKRKSFMVLQRRQQMHHHSPTIAVTHSEKADYGNNFEVVATDDRVGNNQFFGKEQAAETVMGDNENNLRVSVKKKDVDMADAFSSPTKEQATAQVMVATDSATYSDEADDSTSLKVAVEKEHDEVMDDDSSSAEGKHVEKKDAGMIDASS
eukprot:7744002-Ditylum_brightwellii.AAC.1